MVERARQLLNHPDDGRGVAFLSFTNAAVNELETRLRAFGVLPAPLFPSFIGTFDRFLWQFLISPFGIPDCDQLPKLVPDKSNWEVKPPYDGAQALRLRCFDRATGKVIPALAKDEGFDVDKRQISAHETSALSTIRRARSRGQIDFEDVRVCVRERLSDVAFAKRLGAALAALSGILYVSWGNFITPSVFGVTSNILPVIWVAVAGRRSLLAAILGAVALQWGSQALALQGEYALVVQGALLVVAVLILPEGLISLGQMASQWSSRLSRRLAGPVANPGAKNAS